MTTRIRLKDTDTYDITILRGRSRAGFGEHLIYFIVFLGKEFLNTIACYRKYCHFERAMPPAPLDPPLVVTDESTEGKAGIWTIMLN